MAVWAAGVWADGVWADNVWFGLSGPAAAVITSSGRVSAGTAWNKDWSETYGPDYERARAARPEEVEAAAEALRKAPELDPLEEAQEIAGRSLVGELMSDEADRIVMMTAYYEYLRYKRRKRMQERRAEELLLL